MHISYLHIFSAAMACVVVCSFVGVDVYAWSALDEGECKKGTDYTISSNGWSNLILSHTHPSIQP